MIPADGKLHVRQLGLVTTGAYRIEIRPDPRLKQQDAVGVVANLNGPESQRYAQLFAAAPEMQSILEEALRISPFDVVRAAALKKRAEAVIAQVRP